MVPSGVKLYAFSFDLAELFEELEIGQQHQINGRGGWTLPYRVNVDLASLERVCQHLLWFEFSDMVSDYFARMSAYLRLSF